MSSSSSEEEGTPAHTARLTARIAELEAALKVALNEGTHRPAQNHHGRSQRHPAPPSGGDSRRRLALLETRLALAERECVALRAALAQGSSTRGATSGGSFTARGDIGSALPSSSAAPVLDVDARGWPFRVVATVASRGASTHSLSPAELRDAAAQHLEQFECLGAELHSLLERVQRASVAADAGAELSVADLAALAHALHDAVFSISSLSVLRPRLARDASALRDGTRSRLLGAGGFEAALARLLPRTRGELVKSLPRAVGDRGRALIVEMWRRCVWARDVIRAREAAIAEHLAVGGDGGGGFGNSNDDRPAWDDSFAVVDDADRFAARNPWPE
jgi:hypothetical protein